MQFSVEQSAPIFFRRYLECRASTSRWWSAQLVTLLFVMGVSSSWTNSLSWSQDEPQTTKTLAPVPYIDHQNMLYYMDEQQQRHEVKSAADWQKRRAHILHNMQVVMGELPSREKLCDLDVQVLEEVRVGRMTRKKITFQAEPGDRVPAYLFIPDARGRKLPTVLCLHQTIKIGKEEPAGLGGNRNLHYALHLAERGFITLAPDYPSFGEYPYDFAAHPEYRSGSMKAIFNNMRAVDYLVTLREVDAGRIGVIGHSLGGHNGMFTAVFDRRLRGIVSNCGFTRFHKYYGGKLEGWTSARYMPAIARAFENDPNRVPFDFPEIVAAFAPRAFLASAPVDDSNFEVSGVKDCIESAIPVYQLLGQTDNLQSTYPSAPHDFPSEARTTAYRFLERALR